MQPSTSSSTPASTRGLYIRCAPHLASARRPAPRLRPAAPAPGTPGYARSLPCRTGRPGWRTVRPGRSPGWPCTPTCRVRVRSAAGFTAGSMPTNGTSGYFCAQPVERRGRRRVAGDHDHLRPLSQQETRDPIRQLPNLFERPLPVGRVDLVRQVDQRLRGQLRHQLPHDRQPAHARIKHPDQRHNSLCVLSFGRAGASVANVPGTPRQMPRRCAAHRCRRGTSPPDATALRPRTASRRARSPR